MTETLGARTADLPAKWNPGEVEGDMYRRWVDRGYFEADPASGRPAFSIVIPPPNVTGSLHLGHAMDHTLIDILTRRRRMQGYDALWLPGMDHAGIATQSVVERRMAAAGEPDRHTIGRERFVEKVWEWKAESGGSILGQMERLGDGVDWSRERFTLDEGLSRAVATVFKRMFDDGLIYRAERLVNWSPALRSAISDIEVDHIETEGELVSMRYGDGDASVVVATTRVETMLGDTAVAVHPDDERYAALVGTEIEMPITGRRIPVIADTYVDPEFGSGAVKITPAHDPNDFEVGKRHDLPMPTIMDETGTIAGSGTRFDGMDRFAAREAIREELRAEGRIVAEKRPYVHSVGHCSRTQVPIEPRLSLQWFVSTGPLARAAGDAVREGRTVLHPKEQEKRFFDWVDNMHDWTISRQLWWGHRIPVWYGPAGEVVCVGPDEEPPTGEGWRQDSDVLDTWFSSGLWPFSTLGWPDETPDLERYYPNSVLVTGYDILFFWVVRMMMFGTYAMGETPFRDVYLHGLIRDEHGKKMSKSKGNVIDPLDLMEDYGADALRFTIARGSNPGTDMSLSPEWVAASRNFTTKLWNITRFALSKGADPHLPLPAEADRTDADRWILGRLAEVRGQTDELLDGYQFAKATEGLYHFAWDELADWYVELCKTQLDDPATAPGTRAVLGHVLDALLRMLHPIAPFVTEALWTALTGRETVVTAAWPTAADTGAPVDAAAAARVTDAQKVITEVRRFRTEQGLPDRKSVAARLAGLTDAGLAGHETALRFLNRLDAAGDDFAATATFEVTTSGGPVTVELDTSGAIDVAAERARLGKDLAAAEKERDQADKKLNNPKFTEKAPADVVDGIRSRHAAALADIERITARLAALPEA
ncbi:Valyl-tRNA synthetase [Pseudonocardia sp. Ae168_Ps1]|uniref:valine--tRNA ligase n=1 Tax=unclassified Pseudonocardia TaxID=2619320 RepID=UPI00094B1BE1|nr:MULTISPECIES: valine--tRNA ligase [unclassified Pseudonocardia]OLL73299.1 Valyl-tRNA synthetase [Pseudonocardia sp. Ae150A_Ps1]OLL79278.1 Valyl-tRNA synthetase [Pseudonocardia sp. Ae168_Ps1]OLL86584.1 Valyl-tRNA synthetase [Pseudonocardia sp. Ae263_Ps1]OLL93368.1 Valyl-tRNA synthetase [Pseudonocardia sp. Ae356_Ps1]